MPIFEFICQNCSKRFSALVGVLANPKPPACPACKSENLQKVVARFARGRSEDEKMDTLSDEAIYGDIENDPKAMQRWARDLSSALDEDIESDVNEAIEEEFGRKASPAPKKDDTVY